MKVLLHFIGKTKGSLYQDVNGNMVKKGDFVSHWYKDEKLLLNSIDMNKNVNIFYIIPRKGGSIVQNKLLRNKNFHDLLTKSLRHD